MFDAFSASGFFVHMPLGPRKSGIPLSVDIPAPVRTVILLAWSIRSFACCNGPVILADVFYSDSGGSKD